MSTREILLVLSGALLLSGCGGGGGGSSPPPNPPPPPPADTTPPDTSLTATPVALTNSTTANFTATATEAGSVFEARLDNGAYAVVTASFSLTAAEGAHTVDVRARDAAGNTDASPASFSWTVDTTPPDTTITASPPALTNAVVANFTFGSEPGGTYQVSVDGGAYAASGSSFATAALGNGPHALNVRSTDLAGNVDATPASHSWTVDTAQPTARIVFPTPLAYTDATQLHVRGTAQDTSGIANLSVNGVAASSTDGFAHWSAVVPIAIGQNTLAVSVSDLAGNTATPAAQASVANRGAVVMENEDVAFDAVARLLYILDTGRPAVLAARPSDGFVTVVSDASRGSGEPLMAPHGLTLDGTRALIVDADRLIGVDLATGNRTLLSASPNSFPLSIFSTVAYHAASQRAFAASGNGSIVAIDLANGGARSVFSTFSGSGSANVIGLAMDNSAPTPRLLASDYSQHTIYSVDLANGNRTTISYASASDPGNEIGTGPVLHGPRHINFDAANHRLLVADLGTATPTAGGLVSVDLTNGNRTLLGQSGTGVLEMGGANSVALDAASGHIFVAKFHPLILRYDIAQSTTSRFVDCSVGYGGLLFSGPTGLLLNSISGSPQLYSIQQSGGSFVLRYEFATSTRAMLSYAPNYGTGAALFGDLGNLVKDPRPGFENRALALQFSQVPYVLALRGLDLTTGDRSTLASVSMPSTYIRMSRMAVDMDTGWAVVGLTPFGSGSLVGVDLGTGVVNEIASLSRGGGPPMYDIGAVVVLPGTYPVTTAGRYIVGTRDSLLRITGSGDRNFINGGGPQVLPVEDMVADLANRRVLIGSSSAQALQWVDLDSGDRTMVSGRTPGTQVMVGAGPAIGTTTLKLELDPATNLAYAAVMSRSAVLAIDLVSGDRIIMSR